MLSLSLGKGLIGRWSFRPGKVYRLHPHLWCLLKTGSQRESIALYYILGIIVEEFNAVLFENWENSILTLCSVLILKVHSVMECLHHHFC